MMPEPSVLRGLLPPADCRRLCAQVAALDAALPADDAERQPGSGSIRLRALGAAVTGPLLQVLWQGAAGVALRQRLVPPLRLLDAHCWVRRQYPPALRPAGQHPHQWHQDGALGCRFDGHETLAPLQTLWLPLVDCGDDAPSLEWWPSPAQSPLGLWPPAALGDVERQAPPAERRQARLAAGDALLFGGALLHRTHQTAAMQQARISLEWRFAKEGTLPPRLQAAAGHWLHVEHGLPVCSARVPPG